MVASASAALLSAAAPAVAQPTAPSRPSGPALAPALVTVSTNPASPAVDAYYAHRRNALVWFRDAGTFAAAKRLPAILERAPLDGLAAGPELARQVTDAIARTLAAPPGSSLAEEKMLSAAWVQYVRAVKAPAGGFVYGDLAIAPQVPTPERILIDAARAPSLTGHVEAVAAVNPLYARLREAAWKQAEQGALAPDPRAIANLERARVLPATGRMVVVNTATAQLWMYADGKVQDSMKVIVGTRITPTPMLASALHYVTFNPYWNIPTDVARRAVAPRVVKRGVGYLAAARYEAVSDWSGKGTVLDPATIDWKAVAAGEVDVHLRQLPGPANMMGKLKFGFANDLGIYLHDTPNKGLFAKPKRNFSLGCVRVEDAQRLARWLLGREPVAPNGEPEQFVQLDKGVPVYITYLTARPKGGELTFAEDVYGRDPKAETGLATLQPMDSEAEAAATGANLTLIAQGPGGTRR